MFSLDLNSIGSALSESSDALSGVDFSGKSLKLNDEKDAQPIVDAINACPNLHYLTLTGNTLGVEAAGAIAKALEHHPELKIARFSDMFTGRMKTEVPLALKALGDGMIAAGARLSYLDVSDNALGPIGVEGLAKLLQSEVCSQLEELRLNNNGLGITGGRLLAQALATNARKLKVFVAGRNRLENDGAIALAKVFQNIGTLQEIAMPQNGIYHVGIAALSEAFKCNPALAKLNLNDNTLGARGAAALAGAMPRLKNLKAINFGDCLLKSKGALALAKGLKDNSILLDSLDLSCNEIGRDACMEVVNAITSLPNSAERLNSVVLAGNSLGGAANKKIMRDKLGASAQLSDDEGSGDEYVSDPDEESDKSDEDGSDEEKSEDSATEDAQHLDTVISMGEVISLDNSGVEEVQSEAAQFIKDPSLDNFLKLGPNAVDVLEAYVQTLTDPISAMERRVEALLCVSGLSTSSAIAATAARRLCRSAFERAEQSAETWPLANCMLKGLGLIKSENKDYKIRWRLPACYSLLAEELTASYCPAGVRDTLRLFIARRRAALPPDTRDVLQRHAVYTH
ncbi:ran GTPase-activating protein-like [Epargyreus clarus]|uniref:ran GTPase-activating protein-like n=1 Tax=Epargyreus clarus TaxID=520877 RepID=UPI003C2D70AE